VYIRDDDDDDRDFASLFRSAAVRIVGTTCTCTVAVVLALGMLDALSHNALSRAAGISEPKVLLTRWLPATVPLPEPEKLASLTPAEAVPESNPIVTAAPDVTPVSLPRSRPTPAAPALSVVSNPPAAEAHPPATVVPLPMPAPQPVSAPAAPETTAAVLVAALPSRDALADFPDVSSGPDETEEGAAAIPLPMPAPKRPPLPPTPAQRLHLDAKGRAKAEKCLAEAVYFEARSESLRGQLAVAQVVMNRVFSPFYPNDVCGVVYQNANRRLACQFTFACDGIPERITEWSAWHRAKRIAKSTLDGKIWVAEVGRSTHYHALYVRPHWVREMKRMARYGVHAFYRPRRWGDGSHEPTWSNITHTAARAAIVD
jgi:hypothetical protein